MAHVLFYSEFYQTLWLQQQSLEANTAWWVKLRLSLHVLITSQWKIFIALFPMMALFFKQVAWIAPLSNLLAIPKFRFGGCAFRCAGGVR